MRPVPKAEALFWPHAAERILEGLRRHLAARCGLTPRAEMASVVQALARQHRPELARELEDLAARAKLGPSTDGDLLQVARRAALLRARTDRSIRGAVMGLGDGHGRASTRHRASRTRRAS